MEFIAPRAGIVIAALLIVLVAADAPPTLVHPLAAAAPANVRFLFDLGDGTYEWANETLPNPGGANATWNATLTAAHSRGLNVSWSWSSQLGTFLRDIGNRSPPAGGVGIFLWNRTADAWEPASAGITRLVLKDNDSIAFSDNAFDQVTYDYLYPVPTPDHPYPTLDFRGDASNTGRSPSPSPDGLRILWDRDLRLREIPSSPVVAYGRVYVLTLDGFFSLNEGDGTLAWANPSIKGLSTAAVFNGTLILGGSDGKVHAIDAATGSERWNTTLVARPLVRRLTAICDLSHRLMFGKCTKKTSQ